MNDIYPLTIVRDRYRGTYSGGKYTAWNLKPDEVPAQIFWDDCGCAQFFSDTDIPYGVGDTPEKAVKDLERVLKIVVTKPWWQEKFDFIWRNMTTEEKKEFMNGLFGQAKGGKNENTTDKIVDHSRTDDLDP